MKKHIRLLLLASGFIFLVGCVQNNLSPQKSISSGKVTTSSISTTGKEIFLQGNLSSSVFITGIYYPILVSGNIFLYSGVFSLSIPQEMDTWEYMSQYDILTKTYTEQVVFADALQEKDMALFIRKIVGADSLLSENILCKNSNNEGVVSKSETTVNKQGKNIFITSSLLETSRADAESRTIQESQFCFVDSGMIYIFSVANYQQAYIQTLFQSLTFFI